MFWKQTDSENIVEKQVAYGGAGAIKICRLFRGTSSLPVNVAVNRLEPGASEGSHTHGGDSPLEELYYFLEGKGVMWMDGHDVPVAAGDAVLVPQGVEHGFRNIGDGPLKLVIIWGVPEN